MSEMYKRKPLVTAVLMASAIMSPITVQAELEEVIVTANKRAESANDIGLSITALSASKLTDQKLTSIEEITSSVPGLTFATSQQNTPILTLRGVGFNESSLGVYPATSLYVDEVPLPFPAMTSHSAYDLERAEVLKGPQGVLFGTNSTGGAINFIAAKPTEEFTFGGDFSYGNYNKTEANGFVSGALSDKVTARLAVQSVHADEWQESVTTSEESGKEDYTAARMLLRFRPTNTAEINFGINGWSDKSDPQALQLVGVTPKALSAVENATLQVAQPLTSEDAKSADWSPNAEPSGDKEFFQVHARGDFDLTDSITLTTLASYSDYEQNQTQDGDGYRLNTADFRHNIGEVDSAFVEVRLAGDQDAFRWIVGANYEDSGTSEDQYLDFSENTSNRAATNSIHSLGSFLEQDIQAYGIFGNVDIDFSEDWVLKVGTRYTNTKIKAVSCIYGTPNDTDQPDTSSGVGTGSNFATLLNIFGGLSSNTFTDVGVGDCGALDDVPGKGVPGAYRDTLAEDNISWRLGLDYIASNDLLVYANVSQGYKAGSFPNIAAFLQTQLTPVTEESVMAYEIGFKASFAEGRAQWNSAIFHYNYEDKQVRGKTLTPIFGPLDRLVNIPESTITGIEMDITAQLTENMTLTAALTYIDSEVKEYPATLNGEEYAFDVYGVNRDLSGESLPLTPELSYSIDLDYRLPLRSGGELFMGTNIVGQSKSDAVFDGDDISLSDNLNAPTSYHKSLNENYFVIDEYFTVGARIGYESKDGRTRLMLWGKNITDEYYWNSVISSSETGARMAGRPRTFGVTVSYQY